MQIKLNGKAYETGASDLNGLKRSILFKNNRARLKFSDNTQRRVNLKTPKRTMSAKLALLAQNQPKRDVCLMCGADRHARREQSHSLSCGAFAVAADEDVFAEPRRADLVGVAAARHAASADQKAIRAAECAKNHRFRRRVVEALANYTLVF